jgi:EGF-like domain
MLQDRFLNASVPFGLPDMDPEQNLNNIQGGNSASGSVLLSFSRKLNTGDPDDVNLDMFGQNLTILAAWGARPSGNDPGYHGPNHAHLSEVNLYHASTCAPSPCPNACSAHGSCNVTTKTCSCQPNWLGDDCGRRDLSTMSILPGFKIEYFATGVGNARQIAQSHTNSSIFYVGSRTAGNVYAVIDQDKDGVADEVVTILKGKTMPNGVLWYQGSLFVAEAIRITRYDNIDTTFRSLGSGTVILDNIPTKNNFWHAWKILKWNAKNNKLVLPVGSVRFCCCC